MIQQATLDFIAQLKHNNTTDWFKAHQADYKASRADFENMVATLIIKLSAIDTGIAKQYLQAKKCIKRINRDIRFAADKSPYKTNYFATFNPGGLKSPHASYYLHLAPNNSFVGGGAYMPEPAHLYKIRTAIADEWDTWQALMAKDDFVALFPNGIECPSQLKTAPKGFDKAHPAIHYLRMKGYYTLHRLSDEDLTTTGAVAKMTACFTAVKPLLTFLNSVL